MKTHTLKERAELYNQSRFGQSYPDSRLWASDRWLYGVWVLGNDYRGSGLYGAYPPSYLRRMATIFPDAEHTLHLFSGSLPQAATRSQVTVDLRCTPEVVPGVQADAVRLPFVEGSFDLVYADPPYTKADAAQYETSMVDRRKALYDIHRVVVTGGFLVWLDTSLPIYAKAYWHWCGAIGLWRSSNHRVRGVHVFERRGAPLFELRV